MNVFTATGRLGRNVEVRQTQNGTSVAGMPIAVDFGFGDSKGAIWLDASLWGKRAESGLIGYLVKGQQVAVSGELGQRKYTNKEGVEVVINTLKIAEIDLVGGQAQSQPQQRQQPQRQPAQPQQDYRGHSGSNQPNPTSQPANQPVAGGGPTPITDFDDDIPFAPAHYIQG